jgi:hypothetical protein
MPAASGSPHGNQGSPSAHGSLGSDLASAVQQNRDPQVVFGLDSIVAAYICHHQIATQPSRRQLHLRQCLIAQAAALTGQKDDLSPRH